MLNLGFIKLKQKRSHVGVAKIEGKLAANYLDRDGPFKMQAFKALKPSHVASGVCACSSAPLWTWAARQCAGAVGCIALMQTLNICCILCHVATPSPVIQCNTSEIIRSTTDPQGRVVQRMVMQGHAPRMSTLKLPETHYTRTHCHTTSLSTWL